jgi:uncharacterized cupin superfamily protein
VVAPRVEEVEAAARDDRRAGCLEGLPGDLQIVDDQADVALCVGRLHAACAEGEELVAHVDERHSRNAAAECYFEHPAVEVERLVDVAHLNGDVVDADEARALSHHEDDNDAVPAGRPVNLYDADLEREDDDPPGYEAGYLRLGPLLGSVDLGATIYELEPGNSNCPYHYEYGNEEWLLVLSGTLTVRHSDGETELGPGDVASFLEGSRGAHKLTNNGRELVRFVMISTKIDPSMAVYPDSDKVGAWSGPGEETEMVIAPRGGKVNFWDEVLG